MLTEERWAYIPGLATDRADRLIFRGGHLAGHFVRLLASHRMISRVRSASAVSATPAALYYPEGRFARIVAGVEHGVRQMEDGKLPR